MGVGVMVGVEVAEGVGVKVFVGVAVGVGVSEGVGVKVGPNNCPGAHPERNNAMRTMLKAGNRCDRCIFLQMAVTVVPGGFFGEPLTFSMIPAFAFLDGCQGTG
jgi:hypothetical protein